MAITFERPLSPFIKSVLASSTHTYGMEVAAIVTFKDASQAFWATTDLTMDAFSIDGASVSISDIPFTARLAERPSISQSQGKQPDLASLKITNLDYLISAAITNSSLPYDNATVVIFLCFPKPNGKYEGVNYFPGLVRDLSGDDQTGEIKPISELTSKNAFAGYEITQRCTNNLGDAWCQVNHLPGGAVCTKVWHDMDAGCGFWQGVYRGGPFINPNSLTFGSSTGIFTTGDPWEHHCCDLETTWYRGVDGDIHASEIKKGDVLYTLGKIASVVEDVKYYDEEYRYKIRTNVGAGLIISASHELLTSPMDKKGLPAHEWDCEKHDLVVSDLRTTSLSMRSVGGRAPEYTFEIAPPGQVVKLSMTKPHTFLASNKKGIYIASHNKQVDPYESFFQFT